LLVCDLNIYSIFTVYLYMKLSKSFVLTALCFVPPGLSTDVSRDAMLDRNYHSSSRGNNYYSFITVLRSPWSARQLLVHNPWCVCLHDSLYCREDCRSNLHTLGTNNLQGDGDLSRCVIALNLQVRFMPHLPRSCGSLTASIAPPQIVRPSSPGYHLMLKNQVRWLIIFWCIAYAIIFCIFLYILYWMLLHCLFQLIIGTLPFPVYYY